MFLCGDGPWLLPRISADKNTSQPSANGPPCISWWLVATNTRFGPRNNHTPSKDIGTKLRVSGFGHVKDEKILDPIAPPEDEMPKIKGPFWVVLVLVYPKGAVVTT